MGIDQYYLFLKWSYNQNADPPTLTISDPNPLLAIPTAFGQWFLAMMNFVSISLLVTLEMVKFAQGIFIEFDWMMYDEEKEQSAKTKSSNLNEELGMINYIFSDKTGTLTKNVMEFKKFSAGLKTYGVSMPDQSPSRYERGVSNVNFEDPDFENDWKNPQSDNF